MVTWRVHPEKRQAVFSAFAQMTADEDKKDTFFELVKNSGVC